MAELAGLLLSGVGLVALVSTVTDCFETVETARGFGRQYEQHVLQLDIAKFALQRWCNGVNITDSTPDPAITAQLALIPEEETELVRKLLGNIQLAFQEAEKTSRRSTTAGAKHQVNDAQETQLVALDEKVRRACRKRQGSVSMASKARWVVHDAKALQSLVEQVSRNVKSLVEMVPGATRMSRREFRTIVDPCNTPAMTLLQHAAESVDTTLEQRVIETLMSNAPLWEDNVAEDHAKAAYGDIVGSDFTGKIGAVRYRYSGNRASDSARVTYGTRYGTVYSEPFSSD